jgi:hypothetical protein
MSLVAWGVAFILALVAGWLAWRDFSGQAGAVAPAKLFAAAPPQALPPYVTGAEALQAAGGLPAYHPATPAASVARKAFLRTIIPTRSPGDPRFYTVQKGDSIFEIAKRFKLHPESVLWGNYSLLNDNPDLLSLDMQLLIPPVDGVLYQWQSSDSLEAVAGRFHTDPQAILNWPGNNLDLTDPRPAAGAWVMIPGGRREYRQWLIPTIPRGAAGVSPSVYGGGACTGSFNGALGTGKFVWPTGSHNLSGNDYWDGHLGIDIGVGEGQPVAAADGGVIVFAGWANGGYGNTVMIDHGNGYQTLYGHLSKVTVNCGQSISQGGTIGLAGSTGNSTGPHLHFEVRYQGGFINPWYVLP